MENIMSVTTGQKHTNDLRKINPRTNKPYYYKDDPVKHKARREYNNPKRMFVDGKYIPMTHPLHKSGRYTGFTDAAFSSLENYEQSLEGEVYIIYNPSFPSWIKVGMAVDSEDRLKQYQTGSPHRDYSVYASYSTNNRREAEAEAHRILEKNHERKGEWFVCSTIVAKTILDKYFKGKQLELF